MTQFPTVRVAAAQATPVVLDVDASVAGRTAGQASKGAKEVTGQVRALPLLLADRQQTNRRIRATKDAFSVNRAKPRELKELSRRTVDVRA